MENVEQPISLQHISLDWGGNRSTQRKPPKHGENMQTRTPNPGELLSLYGSDTINKEKKDRDDERSAFCQRFGSCARACPSARAQEKRVPQSLRCGRSRRAEPRHGGQAARALRARPEAVELRLRGRDAAARRVRVGGSGGGGDAGVLPGDGTGREEEGGGCYCYTTYRDSAPGERERRTAELHENEEGEEKENKRTRRSSSHSRFLRQTKEARRDKTARERVSNPLQLPLVRANAAEATSVKGFYS
ncbi:hypothetical protein PGIGA_G00259730 [Pangasianodon gigas]|uniref:Uncharacterized protein n=1 Tax=Pangasianodon gigas TaxID=30993 RepID=A0ACC5WSN2_PANGG|nr:hypothetical protein [Pangasianodon gigas]